MTIADVTFMNNLAAIGNNIVTPAVESKGADLATGFNKVLETAQANSQANDPNQLAMVTETKGTKTEVKTESSDVQTARDKLGNEFRDDKLKTASDYKQIENTDGEEVNPIEKFETEVKELIEEAFGVSEKELEDVMALIGMTFTDLIDPQNFVQLTVELTGVDSATELLTSDTFKQLFENITNLIEDLADTLNVDVSDLSNLLNEGNLDDMTFENFLKPQLFEGEETLDADMSDASKDNAQVLINTVPVADELNVSNINVEKTVVETVGNAAEVSGEAAKESVSQENNSSVLVDGEDENTNISNVAMTETDSDETQTGADQKGRSGVMELPAPDRAPTENVVTPQPTTTFQTVVNQTTGAQVVQMTQTYVNAQNVIEQFVTNVSTNFTAETTDLTMQLNPENLGRIYLHVSEQQGQITAKIAVENEAVKEIMAAQMTAVKESLQQSGVKIEAVEVSVGTHKFEKELEEGNHDRGEEKAFEEQEAK